MDTCDLRKFGLEMLDGTQVWILRIQITESAPKQREKLGLMVIGFRTEFDQLDEIRCGLSARKFLADAAERILQRHFRERVQIRFAAARNLYFGFKEQIQLARETTLGPTRAFRDGLNAA